MLHLSQSQNFYDKLQSNQVDSLITPVKNTSHYFSPRSTPTAAKIKQQIVDAIVSQ